MSTEVIQKKESRSFLPLFAFGITLGLLLVALAKQKGNYSDTEDISAVDLDSLSDTELQQMIDLAKARTGTENLVQDLEKILADRTANEKQVNSTI